MPSGAGGRSLSVESAFGRLLSSLDAFSAGPARNGLSGPPRCPEVREEQRGVRVARYYDPATGQFLSLDPDVAQTLAPFNYAGDDPVNEGDPSGLSPDQGQCASVATGYGAGPPTSQEVASLSAGGCNPDPTPSPFPCPVNGTSLSGLFGAIGNGLSDIGGFIGQSIAANGAQLLEIAGGAWIAAVGGDLCVAVSAGADVVTGGVAVLLTPGEIVACGAVVGIGGAIALQGVRGLHAASGSGSGGGGYGKSQVPSWVFNGGYSAEPGETPVQAATRIMDGQYGPGNWVKGPGTEFNQIVKWISRTGGRP